MLCHDPRISTDRSHKVETENPALMLGEIHRDFLTVDWDKVAEQADLCDEFATLDDMRGIPPAPLRIGKAG